MLQAIIAFALFAASCFDDAEAFRICRAGLGLGLGSGLGSGLGLGPYVAHWGEGKQRGYNCAVLA